MSQLHFMLRHFGHENGLARTGQRDQRNQGQQKPHSGDTVYISSGR